MSRSIRFRRAFFAIVVLLVIGGVAVLAWRSRATVGARGAPPSSAPVASSPGARAIADAAGSGTHLERLTPMAAPAPFDAQAYARDPAAYCAEVVPGRIYLTATPGATVPPLTSLTSLHPEVARGEPTRLAVRATAGAPVTFTAKDGGSFAENHLDSITVAADREGTASVTYVPDRGTVAVAQVMAGSPTASGNCLFSILVHAADTTDSVGATK